MTAGVCFCGENTSLGDADWNRLTSVLIFDVFNHDRPKMNSNSTQAAWSILAGATGPDAMAPVAWSL